MATISIPDETFKHLTRWAAAMNTTVEALTVTALGEVGSEPRMKGDTPQTPGDMPYAV